ncbi:restriction endonuclease subunit S [Pseudoalteromonas sp. APC 3356]|uniref:restriction endonuclease subunit S n=1 Tax=Pseudoalteromonas sp. APC 3356 TaxID=3035185 RepID=UPI0025B5E8D6|nr:restriction endonuclease subunit S [Pseudoalteromonas sp. APC 3356]MDN3435368.1 restriction endonuclease subunit S [Pseudoalteromonas sp. APC 3356]
MTTKLLSEISTNISSGLTPLRSNAEFWENGTIPWLKTEQLGEKYIYETNEHISEAALKKTSIKLFPENSLSIAMYGEGKTRGNLSILKEAMATNQACCNVAIDPEKADFEYVYYFLKTQYDKLRNLSSGVRKNLNSNDIKNYPIRLPVNLDSQKKIANVLKALDKKIELNNRINAELEALAKTLYDYWFVQFDFPDDSPQGQGKPYKTSGGKMVYNPTLKREIPQGWDVRPITDCCDIVDCLHSKKPEQNFVSPDYFLLQLENIRDDGLIDVNSKYFVSQEDYANWTSRIEVKKHDVVMTNAGRIAAFAQIPFEVKCGIGRNITAIRPHDICPNYFFSCLSGFDIQSQILTNLDHGAFFKSFNVKGIKALNIVRPSDEIEEEFEKLVSPIIEKRQKAILENHRLINLRDWLLPMLMNGQVTVGEAS